MRSAGLLKPSANGYLWAIRPNAGLPPYVRLRSGRNGADGYGAIHVFQSDYESFTDSCLPADMNPGWRIPRLWASRVDHDHGMPPR